jgi:hypothetical protein
MNFPTQLLPTMKIKNSSRSKISALTLACAFALHAVSHAAVVVGVQFNSGDVLPSPTTAVSTDLLQTSVASASGENAGALVRNGTTGTAHENTVSNPPSAWGQLTTTYTLDVTANTLGYDINELRVFSGWLDNRAGQSFSIDYSLVGSAAFVSLTTVSELNSNGSLMTRIFDDALPVMLSGVDQIRFNQIDNGFAGTGTVFREFDLIGTATIPEPSTVILGGIGLMFLVRRRRDKH